MTAGAIGGQGTISLGSKNLTVTGGSALAIPTLITFSGSIQDAGAKVVAQHADE
jgi:hypothetical protein